MIILFGTSYFLFKYFYNDIDNFIGSNFPLLKDSILKKGKYLIYLITITAIFCILLDYSRKYFEEKEKIITEAALEMKDYIISILESTVDNTFSSTELDVEEFSNYYAEEKNHSEKTMKNILDNLDKLFKKKNSRVIKITLYYDGKMKSFWKFKKNCI